MANIADIFIIIFLVIIIVLASVIIVIQIFERQKLADIEEKILKKVKGIPVKHQKNIAELYDVADKEVTEFFKEHPNSVEIPGLTDLSQAINTNPSLMGSAVGAGILDLLLPILNSGGAGTLMSIVGGAKKKELMAIGLALTALQKYMKNKQQIAVTPSDTSSVNESVKYIKRK